jgi:hypothetical protein
MWVAALALVAGVACGDDDGAGGADAGPDAMVGELLECDVAIVGGGAGGLHTAFRLAPTMGAKVCLFEKEAALGGRIHDIPMNEGDPQSPVFGTGARRVMEGQTVLFDLATELNLTLETPGLTIDQVNARGTFAFGKDAFAPLYPTMTLDPDGNDHESYLYDALRFGPTRAMATSYADFRAYIRDTVGEESFQFLHDMSRFRADFEYPLDARGYLDYLDEEWDVCCTPSYPVGGMSAFIRGMEAKAVADGARLFTGEPVARISRAGSGYELVTSKHTVRAGKVVIAVPPEGLEHIHGDVAEAIKAQPEYQAIIAVRVVTVTQWWPEAWWEQVKDPSDPAAGHVWRAWTTEQCLNFIEIPLEPYAVNQKVTRTVYDDDLNCVLFWEELAKQGTGAVEAEIQRELEALFLDNGATVPATFTIPKPLKTHVQVWPAAWHWIRAGAPFTNADVFAWAVEPLAGEDVALVGEAYNPQRSGWSDGAYKSSINLLNTRYGMSLSGLEPEQGKPGARAAGEPRRSRAQGGH